jgi:arsenite methyltransferase
LATGSGGRPSGITRRTRTCERSTAPAGTTWKPPTTWSCSASPASASTATTPRWTAPTTRSAGASLPTPTTEVSTEPERDFIFPTGRAWAEERDYPRPELSHVPDATVESFAGVANPWSLGRIEPGSVVLDLGCGAGTDLLIAAQMTGADGRVIGIDMTSSMLERARAGAEATGLANVELHHGLIEDLPLADESVDVVISNGVIDLVPDKDAVFAEIDRVLRPGGRLQLADVVIRTEVSEDARKRIDLWTG